MTTMELLRLLSERYPLAFPPNQAVYPVQAVCTDVAVSSGFSYVELFSGWLKWALT